MGKKNFRRKASKKLLETLRTTHWNSVVLPLLKSNGYLTRKQLLFNLSNSQCAYPFRNQLLDYMIEIQEVEIVRYGSSWRIQMAREVGRPWTGNPTGCK